MHSALQPSLKTAKSVFVLLSRRRTLVSESFRRFPYLGQDMCVECPVLNFDQAITEAVEAVILDTSCHSVQ